MNHIMKRRKKMKTKNNLQEVNGNHYERLEIEPVVLFKEFRLNWFQAEPIKYISRFVKKNGVSDLNKAKHIISMSKDMGIYPTIPQRVEILQCINIIKTDFVQRYMVQFHDWFVMSKSEEINTNYYQKFCDLIINIILCQWSKALIYLDEIIYYFYGKEAFYEKE